MRNLVCRTLRAAGLYWPVRRLAHRLSGGPFERLAARRGLDLIYRSPHLLCVRRGSDEIRLDMLRHANHAADMIQFFDHFFRAIVPEVTPEGRVADYSHLRLHPSLPESDETTAIYLSALALSARRGLDLIARPGLLYIRRGADEIRLDPRHADSAYAMIEFFDYYFGATVPEVTSEGRVADYSQPRLHRLSRSGVDFEFPSLPESDETTTIYLNALGLMPGDAVLDVGAYAGASTYFFARAVGPSGLVAAFEPDAGNRRCVEANVARHALGNVRTFACGVWEAEGELAFQSDGSEGSAFATLVSRDYNVQRVPVVTLEGAAHLAGATRIAGIKMDIEGAEVEVLRAAGAFLRAHQPRLVVEPHLRDSRMNTDEVRSLLHGHGYATEVQHQGSLDWPLILARPG
jgi:FkbM family methyltransferase